MEYAENCFRWRKSAYEQPSRSGHDHPYFARQFESRASGDERDGLVLLTHWPHYPHGPCMPPLYVQVSANGIEAFEGDEIWNGAGHARGRDGHELPAGGWRVKAARCDQTGGMCMVDVYDFDNGYRLTVNADCALLWADPDAWDSDVRYNDYVAVLDFTMSNLRKVTPC